MDRNRIIDSISSPADLKVLTEEELSIVAREIRDQIVDTTSKTGGHVASSLGAVDIIVALHSLLDCPRDRIVFDVGHQSYAHKILTGRLDRFSTLRQYGGLSGFTKPSESPYDVHCSGHASDSLSVACGLAKARDIAGEDYKVVAVIGDAALSGGMAFEALNQIGQDETRMLIILNDNQMSINRNVGALMRHLGFLRASGQYRRAREGMQDRLEHGGQFQRAMLDIARNAKESAKQFMLPRTMIFEQLGILCSPPVDGHDIKALRETMQVLLDADVPALMHVVTQKGHGYPPAEATPEVFHGVGAFDKETGIPLKSAMPASAPKYTSVFSDAIVAEAKKDDRIVAITAAMRDGTGLTKFSEEFPNRFFDVGISEGHAVGLASGLAIGGCKPVVAVYSTFMQRALDQIIVDNALMDNDVVFCLDRAGIVGADGPTHQGIFDIAYTRMIPNMHVLAPSDEAELVCALHTALANHGSYAIRYPRGTARGIETPDDPQVLPMGESRVVREGNDCAILAFGHMVEIAEDAARILEEHDIDTRVVDMRWVKPLDRAAIVAAAECKLIVTVEEGVRDGGAGEGVLEVLAEEDAETPTIVIGVPDTFPDQGDPTHVLDDLGLSASKIASRILDALKNN